MKINPAPFHLAQAIITGLVVALSIAILGTSAHTLDVFNKQHLSNPWWAPMWPQHFDVQGTKALIASSVVTLVLCGAFLIASFVPQLALRQKYTLRALLSLATLLPTLLLTLITTIWAHMLNNNAPDVDTIQTWTCKMQNSQPLAQNLPATIAVPTGMSNNDFKTLCGASKFALHGTLVVFLLVGASMGVTVVTWMADKWAARQQRKEVEMGNVPVPTS
ncbi:hypothetical protein PtrSN002B_009672 [Pyrenophora tritici-repentis]|uniref:Uncharacterized protein n=2 Tax=Pyrenophora tritici-repentis TaxID=45151 RepID=A0A2W1HI69_9PLEO|nr:uncharacterized protein PTRG_10506 [Pyrenophora tritici-repentis Pt-1C-BFP]KAA8621156.1 hypothetical protein PtrV1_05657 [Pyrenophora tritici-repentis]EDU43556.1 conserved hypothetical protein [Pyrenophora tritici-repentis Pt-1C-BFP]KAF7450400.1 hypothetical protein A1F99_050160 [Pyrenophora tritici-repentis]KAF7573004.1 hypothetical protein PtrM4_079090 [Pyrenophora tritici-repentis]KAG9381376.1 hypothetical protein A1F94_008696 [Pyrenophora tritici-repentis]